MDNLSVHTANIVKEFWLKIKIKILIIVPYCPSLNLVEKVILSIKSNMKKYLSKGKWFGLRIFKSAIDDTALCDLSGFIRACNREVLHKMKDILRNLS